MPKKKSTKKKTVSKKAARKQAATNRAAGKTQISISLSADLVERIDKLAAAENRNRSNFIATALDELTSK